MSPQAWPRRPNDTGWIAVSTLNNGWAVVGTSTVGYRVKDGVVYVRGTISGGTGINVFALPAGCRPSRTLAFNNGNLNVTAAGQVQAATGLAGTLDDIVFIPDA